MSDHLRHLLQEMRSLTEADPEPPTPPQGGPAATGTSASDGTDAEASAPEEQPETTSAADAQSAADKDEEKRKRKRRKHFRPPNARSKVRRIVRARKRYQKVAKEWEQHLGDKAPEPPDKSLYQANPNSTPSPPKIGHQTDLRRW